MSTPSDEARVRDEQPREDIVRVVLARPERKNAQDRVMLHHLGHAHNRLLHGGLVDPAGAALIRAEGCPTLSTEFYFAGGMRTLSMM